MAGGDPLSEVPVLGVGLLVNAALEPFLRSRPEAWDYVEVIPDMCWVDNGPGRRPRYAEIADAVGLLDRLSAEGVPILAHSVGLSLGTSAPLDGEYLARLRSWHERYRFPWHSDHLSAVDLATHTGGAHDAGLALPIPYDLDVLDQVAERVGAIRRALPPGAPFLVENNVTYVDLPEQDMTEPEFLNALVERTGCGLLLDVHNVHANAVNHGFSRRDFLAALDLDAVVEVHVAGGTMLGGVYTDSHAGRAPDEVWEMLEVVVDGAPNLRAVTFEVHDSYVARVGEAALAGEMARIREVLARVPG